MKILVITSSSGGGHDMRARSIKQWAEHPETRDLGVTVETHQALEGTGGLYAFGSELYNWIQKYWPDLHHIYFNLLEWIPFCSTSTIPRSEIFKKFIRSQNPDIIVSTHDHLNHAYLKVAKEAYGPGERKPLTGTYCGEMFGFYGFSKHWVNPDADFFVAAVDPCLDEARRLKMPQDKSWTGGFMLNPDFWSPPTPQAERNRLMREEFGLTPGRFTLILATGANGANNHFKILKAFAAAGVSPQIIALCGRNAEAKADIEAWAKEHPQLPVCALPYRTDMKRVMECADAIFARPGTGTTSEAILAGIPIIFNGIGGVMPQEMITVKYARRHFESNVVKRPGQLPGVVKKWMQSPELVAEAKAGAARARPEGHPRRILERWCDLTERRP
jgi:processive 1,2-diacylglycerol beta-glucosyltransferase